MRFGICDIGLAPLRAEPSDKSEMVSQVLYGESFSILREYLGWNFIRLDYDGYKGWIDSKQFQNISKNVVQDIPKEINLLDLINVVKNDKDTNIIITCGAVISNCALIEHFFEGKFQRKKANKLDIINTALSYLNVAYLWGGRSPFGIDCSGLTQMVYRLHGIQLERDAREQAKQGVPLSFLEESEIGDLVFFDNDKGEINHVGILIGSDNVIHASGKVRVDKIDHTGIYNREIKKYTHALRLIIKIF